MLYNIQSNKFRVRNINEFIYFSKSIGLEVIIEDIPDVLFAEDQEDKFSSALVSIKGKNVPLEILSKDYSMFQVPKLLGKMAHDNQIIKLDCENIIEKKIIDIVVENDNNVIIV